MTPRLAFYAQSWSEKYGDLRECVPELCKSRPVTVSSFCKIYSLNKLAYAFVVSLAQDPGKLHPAGATDALFGQPTFLEQ